MPKQANTRGSITTFGVIFIALLFSCVICAVSDDLTDDTDSRNNTEITEEINEETVEINDYPIEDDTPETQYSLINFELFVSDEEYRDTLYDTYLYTQGIVADLREKNAYIRINQTGETHQTTSITCFGKNYYSPFDVKVGDEVIIHGKYDDSSTCISDSVCYILDKCEIIETL